MAEKQKNTDSEKINFKIVSMEDILAPSKKSKKHYCDNEFSGKDRCKYGQCDFCNEWFGK